MKLLHLDTPAVTPAYLVISFILSTNQFGVDWAPFLALSFNPTPHPVHSYHDIPYQRIVIPLDIVLTGSIKNIPA